MGDPQVAVPHYLDYNPGDGLAEIFNHVPAGFEWVGGTGDCAQ